MSHVSVLYEECLRALAPRQGGIFVDGTAGGGGHAEGLLKGGATKLILIDRDGEAIERCRRRLGEENALFVKADFKEVKQILSELAVEKINGAILDLGVSSFQIDEAERGFSYGKEAPLDMRMDRNAALDAHQVVNGYSEAELTKLIYAYGEERFAPRIARAICQERPIETTVALAEIVKNAIPAAARRTGGHPAKKTFQAIRIEVNAELAGLEQAVEDFIDALAPGGRLAVITFHSLEDRAVKKAMKHAENPCTCPPDFPVCICNKHSKGRRTPAKPILPSAEELKENPRAHSAKLRVFEKIEIEPQKGSR